MLQNVSLQLTKARSHAPAADTRVRSAGGLGKRVVRIRPLISVWFVLILAAVIHFDWHVARPTHTRFALGWSYHWLLGTLVFAVAAWFVAGRWPTDGWFPSALNVMLAVFVGQILEPLGEILLYRLPFDRMVNGARWTAFAEFMAAGLMTYLVLMPLMLQRRRPNENS